MRLLQALPEGFVGRQPVPLEDGSQARHDQVLFVRCDDDAAQVVHDLADLWEGVRGQSHGEVPAPSSEATVGAMPSSGRTSSTWPLATAAPGMPQTTLVASSWAITYAPLRLSGPSALAPSVPI